MLNLNICELLKGDKVVLAALDEEDSVKLLHEQLPLVRLDWLLLRSEVGDARDGRLVDDKLFTLGCDINLASDWLPLSQVVAEAHVVDRRLAAADQLANDRNDASVVLWGLEEILRT
jgi:hypothetical protein